MVKAKIIGQAIFNCKLFIVYIYMKSKQLYLIDFTKTRLHP